MKKIKNLTKAVKLQILKVIATILSACGISSCFVACYGMPVAYGMPENFNVQFRLLGDVNNDGTVAEDEYLKDIYVDVADSDFSESTDENGLAKVYFPYLESSVEFSDKNNIFETKTETIDLSAYENYESDDFEIKVELKRKSE